MSKLILENKVVGCYTILGQNIKFTRGIFCYNYIHLNARRKMLI